jgi:hypothetical protein
VSTIVHAANEAALDFLVLTDHNSLGARVNGWEGWHQNTLLIVGDEVSGRFGHCLALGTKRRINHRQSPQGMLNDINRQNALSFIAHPHGTYRPLFKTHNHAWKDWTTTGFTGLELWSYMFDWIRDFRYYRFWGHYRHPERYIRGPHPDTLVMWDHLCQTQPCVAIGGVDAHARHYGPLPFVVFPYVDAFQTLHTHILLSKPITQTESDIPTLLQALSAGHCFIAYDFLHNATGTRFHAADGSLQMGDAVLYNHPIDLCVHLPAKADMSIVCNGQIIQQIYTDTVTFCANTPGVYRIEARLNQTPWIYTNPIYLRAGALPQ